MPSATPDRTSDTVSLIRLRARPQRRVRTTLEPGVASFPLGASASGASSSALDHQRTTHMMSVEVGGKVGSKYEKQRMRQNLKMCPPPEIDAIHNVLYA